MKKTTRKRTTGRLPGRQTREFTGEERNLIRALAIIGIPQDDIGRILNADADTLRKHCRLEIDEGSDRANAAVVGALYHAAVVEGNVSAQIFWCKTRLGWREKDAEPQPQSVSIVFESGPRPARLSVAEPVKQAA